MRWVYRLQQRIAITRSECNVLLVLALLFGLGLVVRYVQSEAQPLPSTDYAEAERLFELCVLCLLRGQYICHDQFYA